MLINVIEKKYLTRILQSDCQKLQICAYLISGTTSIFESLNPLCFSVTNKGNKTCYYYIYIFHNFTLHSITM